MKKSLLVLLALAVSISIGATTRSYKERAAFIKANPCPATTAHSAKTCPGYVVDHIIPLCAGGADKTSNMQWQPKAASYKKDIFERSQCASLKKAK